MIAPAHGAYQRHAIPPAGPAGTIHGSPAEDRPAPSPRQAVHRTIAPPRIGVHVVGDTPPGPRFLPEPPARPWHPWPLLIALLAIGATLGGAWGWHHGTTTARPLGMEARR